MSDTEAPTTSTPTATPTEEQEQTTVTIATEEEQDVSTNETQEEIATKPLSTTDNESKDTDDVDNSDNANQSESNEDSIPTIQEPQADKNTVDSLKASEKSARRLSRSFGDSRTYSDAISVDSDATLAVNTPVSPVVSSPVSSPSQNIALVLANKAKVQNTVKEVANNKYNSDTIDLSGLSLNSTVLQELCQALKYNKTVTELNLERNALDDNGAAAIADMLLDNTSLVSVKLDGNFIRETGCLALIDALDRNGRVSEMTINTTFITEDSQELLEDALDRNYEKYEEAENSSTQAVLSPSDFPSSPMV